MCDTQVMNALKLKTAVVSRIKEIVNVLLALPKKLIVTYLNFQFKAIFFPICFVIGGLKFVYQLNETPSEPEVEPSSEEIVNAVKRLRNSVLLGIKSFRSSNNTDESHICNYSSSTSKLHVKENGILPSARVKSNLISCKCDRRSVKDECDQQNDGLEGNLLEDEDSREHKTEGSATEKVVTMSLSEFSGNNTMWDVPIIAAKAKYFAKLIKEGDKERIAVARKALNEHPSNPMPKTRREYEKLLEEARNGSWVPTVKNQTSKPAQEKVEKASIGDSKIEDKSVSNVLGKKQKRVEFALDGTEEKSRESVPKCKHDLQLIMQNKLLRRRLSVFNGKLDEVFKACTNLIMEISNLSDQFDKFIFIKDKMANLQFELGEGKKLLREVEADRNEMRSKLMALEKLIEEEEEFLDDVSGESGFEETDVNGDSTDEL